MRNILWRWMMLAVLLLTPVLGHAEGPDSEMERTRCKSPAGAFDVVIRSPSGQPVEDDMTVWVEREGKPPLRVDFDGKTAWFEFDGGDGKFPSACTGTVAFPAKPGWVVVLLATDDRPEEAEQLSAFVYDPGAHVVRSATFRMEPFISPLEVVPGRDGPLFHSTFEFEGMYGCKNTCPPVQGVAVTRMEETALKHWYELRIEGGRLVLRLSPSEMRQREGFAPFFKDDRSFSEAIGFDPKTNTPKVSVYRLAQRADGSKCIGMRPNGTTVELTWRCIPPPR